MINYFKNLWHKFIDDGRLGGIAIDEGFLPVGDKLPGRLSLLR